MEQNYVEELVKALRSDITDDELLELLDNYHDNDIAGAFEQLETEERTRIYALLGAERVAEIFTYFEDVEQYVMELDIEKAAKILENMDSDDALDVLEEVDDDTQEQLVKLMDDESSRDIQLLQSYDEDEIGGEMTTNFILIKNNLTVKGAMRELVKQAGENDNISTIYVCDENERFYGAIDLKDLIVARVNDELEDLISTSYPYVKAHEKISDCIERIRDYAEDSIPVLSDDDRILGIITAQDIIEVVDDELGEDYARLAGLTAEEDLSEKTIDSMKKRMPWLLVLLCLGLGVSTVVGVFEHMVSQIAIIVCFQSLILGMSGNVGTQSLAVTIRVLMDENLAGNQKWKLVRKEMKVGFCNGLALGLVAFVFIGLYIHLFKHHPMEYSFMISACVGIALWVAMIISSMVGTIVPIIFHKIKIDPAVASGPLITTMNDLVAVVTYYGLAWVLLINVFHLV